jgi:hypothetical protein
MSAPFARFMIAGTQPKLTMILFGMLTLLLISKDKPFWAGVSSMLSCLCWQPGLMFAGTALLIFSRYLACWRDWRALKVIIGASITLALALAYFWFVGALGDFWTWTVVYNLTVYAPTQSKPLGEALSHFWTIIRQIFETDIIFVFMSILGLLVFGIDRLRERRRAEGRPVDLSGDALLIPPVIYLAFCVIDFQGGADLIPLFPFIGIFLSCLLLKTVKGAMFITFVRRHPSWPGTERVAQLACWAAAACMALVMLTRAVEYKLEPDQSLQYQDGEIRTIAELLGPDDKIYVHGTAEILVLLNRPNINPYIMWDNGKDDFVAARRYRGSFKSILAEMESQAPKLVALSRMRKVLHRDELSEWVEEHYQRLDLVRYDRVFIRRP